MFNMQPDQNTRKGNYELLRIVAMFLIILHHFAVHGSYILPQGVITISTLWIEYLWYAGKVGVNVFVLISGYFLTDDKQTIKISKILMLWAEMFFYSMLVYVLAAYFGEEAFSLKTMIKHLFPVTFEQWWFASTYVVLYLLSPFLRVLISDLTQRTHGMLVMLLTCIWCVVPTISMRMLEGNDLLWFIYLFILISYIKRYVNIKIKTRWLIALEIACIIVHLSAVELLKALGDKSSFCLHLADNLRNLYTVPVLLESVILFLIFSKINIRHIRPISFISSSAFGIYLIHDNSLSRNILWNSLFSYTESTWGIGIVPYSIAVSLIIFLGSFLIDLIRRMIFDAKIKKITSKVSDVINRKLSQMRNW